VDGLKILKIEETAYNISLHLMPLYILVWTLPTSHTAIAIAAMDCWCNTWRNPRHLCSQLKSFGTYSSFLSNWKLRGSTGITHQ